MKSFWCTYSKSSIYSLVLLLLWIPCAQASDNNYSIQLRWHENIATEILSENVSKSFYGFDKASYFTEFDTEIPYYTHTLAINKNENTVVNIKILKQSVLEETVADYFPKAWRESVSSKALVQLSVINHRGKHYRKIKILPFVQISGILYKIESMELNLSSEIKSAQNSNTKNYPRNTSNTSVLSTGTWYKVPITENKIYKIDYNWLIKNQINPSDIDPAKMGIFGNGGGMLPFDNDEFRADDLQECAVYKSGLQDGQFNTEDFLLFYAQGPNQWDFNYTTLQYQYTNNLFSDSAYCFFTTDRGTGKTITETVENGAPDVSLEDYDFYLAHEKDLYNLIKSGRNWYGEHFNIQTEYKYSFYQKNMVNGQPIDLSASFVARTHNTSSLLDIYANSVNVGSISIDKVSTNYTQPYAKTGSIEKSFTSNSDLIEIMVKFIKGNSSAQAWTDFIQIQGKAKLNLTSSLQHFSNKESIGKNLAEYRIIGPQELIFWDITDQNNIIKQASTYSANTHKIKAPGDTLRTFVSFSLGNAFANPYNAVKIGNQNLHSLEYADLLIITPSIFTTQATDIQAIHEQYDNLSSHVVDIQYIYNEFSGGKQDITAIKDFAKMFYDRANGNPDLMPKYMLLLGDGSYDPKNRVSGNQNFIPTYQSFNSLDPASNSLNSSHTSDDYYGLLDDNEGEKLSDMVDIGIGRLPVKNTTEAQIMVNKIRNYYHKNARNPWRNRITFIADDEDYNRHMIDANTLASYIETNHKEFNINKIYFDSYNQETRAGGSRYPEVEKALDNAVNNGSLLLSYTGHGGEQGWGHERVLTIPMINAWENNYNMPAMVTATCEFSRFDDPQRTAAGELTLLNPDGGAIALLTTTRLVYAEPNFKVAQAFFQNAFTPLPNGQMPRMGDLCVVTKLNGDAVVNTRNFTLIGDPALSIGFPLLDISTSSISDTAKSLSKITIKGQIKDENGNLSNSINGVIYPLILDKKSTISTLNNDSHGVFNYQDQKNIIFKGKASVNEGKFEFSFIVPKDINRNYGSGKISYYFNNDNIDGNDYSENIIIGGIDTLAENDTEGPTINLYMNNEKFVSGGITNPNPTLIVSVFDLHGINTTGNGIGHDISMILDNDSKNKIILNDYYQANMDSYQSGKINYPLKNLSAGKHTITIKIWDVYNNSSEEIIEFVVAKDETFILDHVLNYPNPFSNNTAFYFEHNAPGQNLDLSISIYTISGRLIYSIDRYINSDGFREGPFYWDAKDQFGDGLGRGVYIYKLKLTNALGRSAEKIEKLVILN